MSILDSTVHNFSESSAAEGTIGIVSVETLLAPGTQANQLTQLVVVDGDIENYVQLTEALIAQSKVLVLDPGIDGIAQIDSAIDQFQNLTALHILSHGSAGHLQLGSTQLNAASLSQYEDTLASWENVLTDTADILLYGCNVGEGEVGQNFLDQLSELTGADIAASVNLTGSASLGGDWNLEAAVGTIEADLAFVPNFMRSYAGVLANDYVVQTNPAFQKELVLSGLQEPIDMTFLPDGKMLFIQKNGIIQLFDPNTANATPQVYLDLTSRTKGGAEAGLLSIVLDPDFAVNNYFYIYYSDKSSLSGGDGEYRITRFTHDETAPVANSEFVVYRKPDGVRGHHDGGGLSFGPDGKLYLTLGDQEPSRTADPTWNASLVQDLTTSYGKVMRVNKDGTIPQDNPYADGAGGNLDEIWAVGLRNPYRAAWDVQSGRFFIGDVGGNVQSTAFEEINLGQAGANYGWPNVEGFTGDLNLVDPIYAYDHQATTPNGGAITAGVAYRGSQLPSEYQGAFFFGDYVSGWVRYLQFDASGNVIDADLSTPGIDAFNFDSEAGTVVSIKQAPDGSLYYAAIYGTDFTAGTISRVTYNLSNQLPIIDSATADVTEGNGPLTVNFTGSATDGDNDALTYLWSFGDGVTATGQNASHTYMGNGVYTASLQVSDGTGIVNASPIEIQVGNRPQTTISTSLNGGLFRAGDSIVLNASATDADGILTESSFVWDIDFIHNAHTHPEDAVIGSSFVFKVPEIGHGYSDVTGYRFELTVTDADGLTTTETIDLSPEKVDLAFSSNVPGEITYSVDGLPRVGSFTLDQAINFQQEISVPEVVTVEGVQYTFDSWSNGITTAAFDLVVPETNQSYVANYIITNISANAVDDEFVVNEDAVGATLDVLANDVDPDGDPLTITGVGTASHGGTVSVNATNDRLLYTPVANFVGTETITYGISDGNGDISQATVVVSIRGTNDAPVAIADTFNVSLNSESNVLDVLANDTDPDIANVSSTGIGFDTYEVSEVSAVSPSRALKVTQSVSGGGLDNVDFIFDATTATGNDPHFHMMGMPAAMRPSFLTQHNAGGTGEYISFTMAREDAQAFSFEGFSYTSGLFFAGTNASFTVTGTLSSGGEVSQSFGPAEAETVFQAATFSGAGWKNVTSVRFEGSLTAAGSVVTQELNIDNIVVGAASDRLSIVSVGATDNGGTVTINGTNDGLLYTPAVDFTGTESFSYTIADQSGETSTATVTINTADTSSVPVTTGLVLNLDANAGVTTDGTDLVTGWADQSGLGNDLAGVGDPRLVSGALNGQDVIHFDGAGDKLERLLTSSLPTGNSERTVFMVAKYNNNNGGAGGFAYGTPSSNQTFGLMVDNEGELGVQGWSRRNDLRTDEMGVGAGWLTQSVVLDAGTATLYRDGAALGTKTHSWNTVDGQIVIGAEFDNDPYLDLEVATVMVYDRALTEAERLQVENYLQQRYFSATGGTGGGTNQAPSAIADSYSVIENSSVVALDVLSNDTDPDGDALTITAVGTTDNGGIVSINSTNNGLVYTPNASFTGTESFSYTIADQSGETSTATVTVNVTTLPTVPTTDVPVTTGLVLNLNANAGVTTDGTDLVTGWADQSGLGNDLAGVGDPRLVSGALNGQDVIHFDGAGDKLERLLTSSLPTGNSERTVFMVAKYNNNNGGAGGFAYGTPSSNQTFGLMVDNEGELGVQGWSRRNDLRTDEMGVGAGWLTQSVVLDAGTATLYRDGAALGTKTHSWNTVDGQIVIGAEFDNDPYLDLEVATVMVYDRALTEAERLQVENYLQQRYFGATGGTGGGTNQAPSAIADSYSVIENSSVVALDVLSNDTDPDGDALTITAVGTTDNGGIVSINSTNNGLVYTPNASFTGTESFSYTIADQSGETSTATVTVNVTTLPTVPTTDVPVTTGLVLNLNANAGVTTDGTDLVTGWADQSGLGNDLAGVGDPRLVSGALNGQDVIHFDGAGDKLERLLTSSLPTGNSERTVFMVAKYNNNNGGAGGFAYGTPSSNQTFGLMVDNEGELGVQGWSRRNDLRTDEMGVGAGWLTQSVVLDAGTATLYRDGAALGTKTHSWNTVDGQIVIGAEFDNDPYLDLEVATVMVYDRALTEAERLQVENYLQQRYLAIP